MNHQVYPIDIVLNNGEVISRFTTKSKQGASAQLQMMGVRLHVTIDSAGYWSFKMGRKSLKIIDYGHLDNFPLDKFEAKHE